MQYKKLVKVAPIIKGVFWHFAFCEIFAFIVEVQRFSIKFVFAFIWNPVKEGYYFAGFIGYVI